MSRRNQGRRKVRPVRSPLVRAYLQLECLEGRELLDAAGLTALPLPEREATIAVLPNDPRFGSMDNLHNTGQTGGVADADIDAPEAWDVTTGSARTVVGVIDTGIDYRHQDLFKNVWINQIEIPAAVRARLLDLDGDGRISFWDLNDARNQGVGKVRDLNGNGRIDGGDLLRPYRADGTGGWANGVSDDGDVFKDDLIGWDFVNNDNDPFDDNGHGTHVAGTIGAVGNNGVGVAGVNWKVSMIALKFMGANGSGSLLTAIAALNYAVAKGATVSNNSWSVGDYYYQPLYDAINAARAAGHVYVAAAGNGGADGRGDNIDLTPNYPASFSLDNVVAVAALSRNNGLAAFSNFGAASVDLGAPGLSILSTYPGDRYVSMGGTSMATPHVTGVVALVRTLHPEWTYAQVLQQVFSTVDRVSVLSGKSVTGGRVNAGRTVSAGPRDVIGPRVVAFTSLATSSTGPVSAVRVTFSEALDPSTFTTSDVLSLQGPRGLLRVNGVRAVAGSGNTQFDLLFNQQWTPGLYRIVLGPDIRDGAGNGMDQDRDGLGRETIEDRFTGTFAINPFYTFNGGGAALADAGTTIARLNVTANVSVADLNVKVHISHPRTADLVLKLRGPDGTTITLVNQRGSGGHFTATTFDDEAAIPVVGGAAPFRGSFRPEGSLSAFDGRNARGIWELWVEDRVAGNRGTLYSWSLAIEGAVAGASGVDGVGLEAEEIGKASAPAAVPDGAKGPRWEAVVLQLPSTTDERENAAPRGWERVSLKNDVRNDAEPSSAFVAGNDTTTVWATLAKEADPESPSLEDLMTFFTAARS